jgi:hypothetical protein
VRRAPLPSASTLLFLCRGHPLPHPTTVSPYCSLPPTTPLLSLVIPSFLPFSLV